MASLFLPRVTSMSVIVDVIVDVLILLLDLVVLVPGKNYTDKTRL